MGKGKKTGIILFFLVISAVFGLFIFLFFNCMSNYLEFDVEHSDFMYDELTFNGYDKVRAYRHGTRYEIYFEEYKEPFLVDSIVSRKLDKTSLVKLVSGEVIKIYYCQRDYKNYEYEICEMSTDSTMLLSLSDYKKTNQSNQIIGMVVCSFFVLSGVVLLCVFICIAKPKKKKSALGKIKIEYSINGDVIRVYNSIKVCSLVINDKIVDQYWGVVANKFSLNGRVRFYGKEIPVEAKVGHLNVRLYYDGELVAKKFIGLG